MIGHVDAEIELRHWKEIACHLGSCFAASLEEINHTKSVSKSRRRRYVSICQGAAAMIKEGFYSHRFSASSQEKVVERLEAAIAGAERPIVTGV